MRLSKATVARREARASELFKQGMDIAQVNDTLLKEDGHRMAIGRLYELRDQFQPPTPKIEKGEEPTVDFNEAFGSKTRCVKLSNPDDFPTHKILFKGNIVTVELMEK